MFDASVQSSGGRIPRRDVESVTRLVEAMVASSFATCPGEIRALSRGNANAAFARQVAIYLSHTCLGFNYTAAGRLFGRDRTTAAHACRTVEDKREDPGVDAVLDCLERAIGVWTGQTERDAGR